MGEIMDTKLLIGFAVVLGLLLILFTGTDVESPEPEPEIPSTGEQIGAGHFVLEQGGAVLLEETYEILFHPVEGYMLVSQGRLYVADQEIVLAQQAQFDRGFLPIFYHLAAEAPSGPQIISAQMGVAGLTMEVRVGTSSQQVVLADASDVALLDNNLIGHYAILLMAIRAEALDREFTAAIPQALLSLPASVEGPSTIEFRSGEVEHEGKRFDVSLGDTLITLIEYEGRLVGLINRTQGTLGYDVNRFPDGIEILGEGPEVRLPEGVLEQEVAFASQGLTLFGTLASPETGEGPHPAALFLHGSGPIDRDGNAPGLAMDAYRQLAHALAEAGIASLRFDKRGTGSSEGVARQASMSDLIDDARAALAALRARGEIDPSRVILIGHSEGAYLGPVLAGEDDELAGVALLAGAARPLDDITWWQIETMLRSAGADDTRVAAAFEQQTEYFAFVEGSTGDWSDYTAADLQAELSWLPDAAATQLLATPLGLPWLREHYLADTEAVLRQVTVPVFVLNGRKDSQIPFFEADAIAGILEAAGNANVTVHIVPDLNHFLRNHPEEPSLTYRHVEDPVDPRVVELLVQWVNELLGL